MKIHTVLASTHKKNLAVSAAVHIPFVRVQNGTRRDCMHANENERSTFVPFVLFPAVEYSARQQALYCGMGAGTQALSKFVGQATSPYFTVGFITVIECVYLVGGQYLLSSPSDHIVIYLNSFV
jgi:hypothetical protein